jgi:hypothetical protein
MSLNLDSLLITDQVMKMVMKESKHKRPLLSNSQPGAKEIGLEDLLSQR